MEYIAICLALLLIGLCVWSAKKLWSYRATTSIISRQTDDPSRMTVDLKIPMIGASRSGKTLLLASLGESISHYSPKPTELNTRALDCLQEEGLRNRKLIPFNPKDESDSLSRNVNAPGQRSTKELIYRERRSFGEGIKYQESPSVENAYLSLTFAREFGPQAPICCELSDLPGHYLQNERNHLSNLLPALKSSDGLIIIFDGEVLESHRAEDRPPPHADQYQRALELYMSNKEPGPIWLVITKADLIDESMYDLTAWREYLFKRALPALQLRGAPHATLTLTSAHLDHAFGAAQISADASELFLALADRLKRGELQRVEQIAKAKSHQTRLLISLLLMPIALWLLIGAFSVMSLPKLSGEIVWDWGSLKVASEPYLRLRASLSSPLSYALPYQAQIDHGINALSESYDYLLKSELLNLASPKKGGEQIELSHSAMSKRQSQLKTISSRYLKFQSSVAQWRKRNEQEERRREQLMQMSKSFSQWISVLDNDLPMDALIEFKTIERPWKKQCENSNRRDRLSCDLDKLHSRVSYQILKGSYQSVMSLYRSPPTPSMTMEKNLSPLIEWRAQAKSLKSEDPLLKAYQAQLEQAFDRIWQALEQKIAHNGEDALSNKQRLAQLKRFELERQSLEERFSLAIPLPTKIAKRWREKLNQEVLASKHDVSASELIEWAQDYLDADRLARVRLSQSESAWRSKLITALQSTSADPLEIALSKAESDLKMLRLLQGAREIKEELNQWSERMLRLREWSKSQFIKLNVEELECDKDRFKDLDIKIDEGHWSWYVGYYPDSFKYYLSVHSESTEEPIALGAGEEGEEITLLWSPWSALRLSIYDQDGSRDHNSASPEEELPEKGVESQEQSKATEPKGLGEEQSSISIEHTEEVGPPKDHMTPVKGEGTPKIKSDPNDDDLVGESLSWREQRDPPTGVIKFGPKEVCRATLSAEHPLPSWLYELAWLSKNDAENTSSKSSK